jgi:acetylornithine/succinyldiaminopimelate/putrescine aminotransferase/pimeloyl-ACP methyl ester carboxylesterase/acyl carrier protein
MNMRADATAIEEMSPEQALAMIERMQREAAPAPVPAPAAAIAGAAPVARAPAPPARRARLEVALEDALTQLVMDVLKLEPGDFSPTRSLMDYGMDSISSTEIGNRFTARFDIVIPPTVFFEFQDLRGLTRYLLKNHEADVRRVLDIHGDDSVDVAPAPEAAPVRAVAPAAQPVVARPAAPAAVPVTAPAPSAVAASDAPLSIEALWGAPRTAGGAAPAPVAAPAPAIVAAPPVAHAPAVPDGAVRQPDQAHLDAQQAWVDRTRSVSVQGRSGRTIEAAVYGQGRPVLLLGGLVMHTSVMWRLQLRELGERYRLIMYHMPGCGRTDFYEPLSLQSLSSDVAELLDALGIDEPLPVIGYSFGGVLAQRFCIDHAARVRGLVVTVSSPFAQGANDFATLMRELQKSDRFMALNRGWNIPSLPTYEAVVTGFDHSAALGALRCPALVISGRDDRYMQPAFGRALADALPGARYVCFPGAGHLLGFTHHAAYNRLLLRFLDEVSPATAGSTGLQRADSACAFSPAGAEALQVLEDHVHRGDQGHCAILSPQAAQVGVLLNRILARNKPAGDDYRCLFLTSQHEALDAALRLARHRARNRDAASTGEVLIVDAGDSWQRYFDPLNAGADDALVPGIHFVPSTADAHARLASGGAQPVAVVLVCDAFTLAEEAERLLAACAAQAVVSVLVDCNEAGVDARNWIGPACREPADIYVLGESLAASQVPIGACAVRAPVHQAWSMTPSESYVRNVMTNFGFPLAVAREALLRAFAGELDGDTHHLLRRIDADVDACHDAHLRYGNSGYARVARLHGFDARFGAARGMTSALRDRSGALRQVLDCFVNVGTSPRGLNPLDVVTEVARRHDGAVDYWRELADLLAQRTGLPHAFPASSNVTAVESALTLAALARPDRRRMLFFSGGLGFSMLSAVASHDRVFDIFRKPFEPLYRHSVFIDAHDAQAATQLEAQLLSGDIGLVWFETIQVDANASRPLPPALVELIVRHREAGGYLIGVDETQTNLMTGRLLHSAPQVPSPDLVALGTALCDSLVPTGVVLCSDALRERALQTSAVRVHELASRQQCPLSAHISLHSLRQVFEQELDTAARAAGARFRAALEALRRDIPMISAVRGEGLLITIDLDLAGTDPFLQRSFGYLLWGAMLRDPVQGVAIAVCPIHNNSLRFLPPLNIGDDEVAQIVACLRRNLAGGVVPVVQACSEHSARIGEARTAEFLRSLIPSAKKESQRMNAPRTPSADVVARDFTRAFAERIPGGRRMLEKLRGQGRSPRQLPKVCVIGAGVGGISIGKALTEYGVPFDCFDGRDRIGGIWAFDPDARFTSVWHAMNQNTPRGLYQYSDFPMPDHYPDFPSHQQVHAYLESYVDHFGFRDRICLNTQVDKAEKLPEGGWRVTLDNGEVRHYDAVVVANGHHNEPNFPDYYHRDRFDGEAIHSRYYRYRENYRDKDVLVVGVGNSGSQVAVDISHAAKSTCISLRRGVYVLPHYLFGIRMDRAMAFLNDWWFKKLLPYPLFNLVHTGMYKALIAKRKNMGMPKPDHLMMSSLPTLSENFANRIGDGKLKIVPEVKRIDGRTVTFADGSQRVVDAIVYSTGFKTTFPFLDSALLKTEDNKVPMYKRIFVPGMDDLAFIGLFQAVTWGFLDMMEAQSKMVAEHFAGFYKLPALSEQRRDIEREQRVIKREFLATLRNNYEMHGPTYMHELAKEHKRGRARAQKGGLALPCPAAGRTIAAPAGGEAAEREFAPAASAA